MYVRVAMNMIKTLRKGVFKVTQAQFAEIAGVTQSTIARWETGEITITIAEMRRIRDYAIENQMPMGLPWTDSWFFEPPELDRHHNIVRPLIDEPTGAAA